MNCWKGVNINWCRYRILLNLMSTL